MTMTWKRLGAACAALTLTTLAACTTAPDGQPDTTDEETMSSTQTVPFEQGKREVSEVNRVALEALYRLVPQDQWTNHGDEDYGVCGESGQFDYYTELTYTEQLLPDGALDAVATAVEPLGYHPGAQTEPGGKGYNAAFVDDAGNELQITSIDGSGTTVGARTGCRLEAPSDSAQ